MSFDKIFLVFSSCLMLNSIPNLQFSFSKLYFIDCAITVSKLTVFNLKKKREKLSYYSLSLRTSTSMGMQFMFILPELSLKEAENGQEIWVLAVSPYVFAHIQRAASHIFNCILQACIPLSTSCLPLRIMKKIHYRWLCICILYCYIRSEIRRSGFIQPWKRS